MTGFATTIRSRGALVVMTLLASMLVPAGISLAQTAPKVQFLNPSGFASAGPKGLIVTDTKPDTGPGCCAAAKDGFHLSAWVANAPSDARVFFSVTQETARGIVDLEITNTNASSDGVTWDTNWSIPDEVIEGPATLSAHLVQNEQQIAVDRVEVNIVKDTENLQISYPAIGGQFGQFTPLADELPEGESVTRTPPVGVLDTLYTAGPENDQIRAFYTTSAPGTEPTWKSCGTESVRLLGATEDGVRCTLATLADQGKVTAVAAVTNSTPWPGFDPQGNLSGDAVAISSVYEQIPTTLSLVTTGSQRVDRDEDLERFPCAEETVALVDQVGRAVAGANIDVHATGPSDSFKFDHDSLENWTGSQPPDRGVHSLESAYDCFSWPANMDPGQQAEHQRFGAPDRKHIEDQESGTTDLGRYSFMMFSSSEGLTEWTAWLDEMDDGCSANDDTFTQGELNVSGSVGWGVPPASIAVPQPFEALIPCVPEPGESPSPGESPGEEPEFDGDRAISLRIDDETLTIGQLTTFSGRITADRRTCEQDEKVVLKTRRPGQKYWKKAVTRSDGSGSFEFTTRLRAPRDYVVVAPAADGCKRTRSEPIRMRKS